MDAVEDIKSRLDIADLVGEYLQLKPAGSGSFKANCPFHQEKTPSFYVNRPRQSWHCFGCDQGGDVISFVQRMEGMEFPEALEHLAHKTGVELPRFDSRLQSERKRLMEVNDMAARYYRATLLSSPAAQHARDYVSKRGLDDLTGDLWRIGYAPEGWRSLSDELLKREVKEDELVRSGLCLKSDRGGVYDRFRGRLMFPIMDVHGNVLGFTGRILPSTQIEPGAKVEDQGAKYINTPETLIYKKSLVLFGLDKAKGEIKREDLAVIVEGNMDVISSHQFNVSNVIASSGTALTDEQLRLLKRFTNNLAIAFDADKAGNAATIRGLDLARTLDFNVRIITLPEDAGKDPDDAVRKDVAIWKKAIHDALPVVEWLYRDAFRGADVSKPEGKKLVAKTLLPEFLRIADAVERDAWISRLARDLDISSDSLREAIKTAKRPEARNLRPESPTVSQNIATQPEKKTREQELQERVLSILYLKPELRTLAETWLPAYDLPNPSNPELLNFIAVLADREFQDQSKDALTRELEQACAGLKSVTQTGQRTRLEQEMREAERTGDTARIETLLAQFNELIQ